MQASKISVAICLSVVSVMPFVARADDTPQQARLRELLHAAEAGHPYPTEAPAPAVTNAPMEMPAAVAPAMTPPAAPSAPDMAAPAMTPPAVPATPDMAAPAAPTMETPAVTAPAEPAMTPPAAPTDVTSPVVVVPPPADASAPAAAMAGMSSMDTNATAMQSTMTNAEASAMKQAQKPAPIPQRDLTADQRQRLDSLTAQYKADQLSPEQYHDARAKILAEP